MVLPDGVVGVVLDLNNGENNDTSPTTWEVALESKMKKLVRGGATDHGLSPGVFICKVHSSWLCLDRSSGLLGLSCLASLAICCSHDPV